MSNEVTTEVSEMAIGRSNAAEALDQAHEYESRDYALAAYLVNTVDTAREYKLSPTEAVKHFQDWVLVLNLEALKNAAK
jgi:hypothetical protein